MSSRYEDWAFVRFCVAMAALMGVLGVGIALAQAGAPAPPTTTTVSDTVYRGDGTPAGGTVLVSWPAFTTSGGASVPAGNTAVVLGSGGQLVVSLVPNSGSNPMGSYYTVVYHLNDGSTTREYWVIPVSATPVGLAAIRNTVLPASVAMQTVTKAYVDQAITAASLGTPLNSSSPYVLSAGDTMTGPLVLPGDPVSTLQAADKHYVDTQVASVGGGSGQKVSTLPFATQTVAQPVGTTLAVTNLNGVEQASLFASGAGNNGIANATATADCANGCTVVAEPTYHSGELPNANAYAMGTHVEDLRDGAKIDTFRDPLNVSGSGQNGAEEIDLTSTRNSAALHQLNGTVLPSSQGLVIKQQGLTGGDNQYPVQVQGAVPYFKTTYSAEALSGTYSTPGQHVQVTQAQDCYGVGDCLMGSQFMRSSGGFRDDADEGAHPFDLSFVEDPRVLEGTCQGGCVTGSTQVQVAVTANPGTQGEGRYLIDTNPAKVLTAGTIASGSGEGVGRQPSVTFAGTNFPVSTLLETSQTITTQANAMQPGTVTVPIVTTGVPTGFQTNTAALPTASGVACVTDAAVSDGRPLNYEMAAYTTVDGSHLQMTLNRAHAAGATIAVGGLCGYGLEQTVDTTAGIRQVFPVVGSTSSTTLLYAGGITSVVGVGNSTSGYLNLNVPVAGIARTGNVVTVTTAGNLPVNTNGLTLTVAGVADASYNGSFVVTTTGPNTLTYNENGANSTSSGGTLGYVTGGFALYPMAEVVGVYNASTKAVDGQMNLAANTVPWATGDTVEQPHYFQERVGGDLEQITQYADRPQRSLQAGILYGGNSGPGLYGWLVANQTAATQYLGGGGTRTAPSAAFQAQGVWNTTMDLQPGVTNAFAVHCNLHGCGRWDSAYDLFDLDSAVGVDAMRFSPSASTLGITVRGTGYTFSPQAFTAGTINVGTLNATTINGAVVGGGTGAVFGASGTTHAAGAVPDPGPASGTGRFLREDGTWSTVSGVGNLAQRPNLMMEYLLNEGTGTVAHDTSGQGNNGTIVATSSSPAWEGTTDLNFTVTGGYVQLPVALNQANTFQFAIYEPPFGYGTGSQPPGYGVPGNFGTNASLLCGTDSAHTCFIASSAVFGPVSQRFVAWNGNHTEASEFLTAGWHVVTLVNGQSGALDHYYVDGSEVNGYTVQGTGAIMHPTTGNYQIGGSTQTSGAFFLGKIAAAWAWSTSLSANDVQQSAQAAQAYVQSKGGYQQYRPMVHDAPLVIGGMDSRTYGFGLATPANAWMNNLALTDSTYTTLNLGYVGASAVDVEAMFDLLHGSRIGKGSGPTIEVIWGGVNDFRHGITPQQVSNALKALVLKAKAAGARVVLATEISSNANGDAYKDALNTILHQQAFGWGVDNLADLGTIAVLGADGASSNTTNFSDGLHPTDAVEPLITAVMSNAVNELLGSTETMRHQTAAAQYQELAGDRFLDLTGTAAQTVTLPSCVGYSLTRQIVNVGTVAGTVAVMSGQTLAGPIGLAVGARAVFVPVPGPVATGGCSWERTQ